MNIQAFELPILLLSVIANVSIGLLAYSRNTHSWTNRLFGLLSVAWIGWTITTYLSLHSGQLQLELVRASMFFVIMMNTVFFFLIQIFPKPQYSLSKKQKVVLWYSIVTGVIALSPLLFVSVKTADMGTLSPVPGPGIIFFMLHAVGTIVGGLSLLLRRLKHSSGFLRSQLNFILAGTILFFTIIPLTNFIMPIVFERSEYVIFSPIATVVFAAFISYTIVKHRLFDIRLVVARTAAYLLLLFVLASGYTVIAFGFTSYVFQATDSQAVSQVVYIILAIVLAFTFQPLRRFFDRVTNKIFYRDAYDSEELLDQLNTVFVQSLGVHELLQGATALIADTLKADFCVIGLKEDGDIPQKIIGTEEIKFEQKDIEAVRKITPYLGYKVVVSDLLDEEEDLNQRLRKYDISVLARIASDSQKVGKEGFGYLLLGQKKSGNSYTTKDLKVIELVTNELVIAIQNALRFEEIRAFSETLQKRVKEATGELKSKNKKLRELDKAKDDFISMASHQLRTPLTSVKGYLSMLDEGDFGKLTKKQKHVIEMAFDSSERMVYLIADLLNISRINTGKFVIDSVEVDLIELIKSEVAQLERSANAHDLKLKLDLPKTFPKVMLDETKTRQVMMNFIDNAIYYTPEGGEIVVRLEKKKDSFEFTVNDNGIGVPKDQQEKLFTKFFRADNARKARPDGTGLGLFLARKVITGQGGSIIFKSTEGKGSTFGFRFALANVAAKPPKKSKE